MCSHDLRKRLVDQVGYGAFASIDSLDTVVSAITQALREAEAAGVRKGLEESAKAICWNCRKGHRLFFAAQSWRHEIGREQHLCEAGEIHDLLKEAESEGAEHGS